MRAETQQALRRFDNQFIPFPSFVEAKDLIEENLFLFRETGVARNLVIYGEAGTGKSTLCHWMQTQYGRVKLHDRDHIQTLTVSVPASATIIGLANAVLDALGDPLLVSGTASSKTHRIVTLVKGCKVELLLIDEAQHLHDRGQAKTHYYVADWLKQLIDQIGVPCVLLGLPRLEMLLRANEQLRRRFTVRTCLALGQGEKDMEYDSLQLFMSLASLLDVPVRATPFGATEMGQRLYFACDGRVSYIKSLLHAALLIVLEQDLPVIDASVLEQAFTQTIWANGLGKTNPFSQDFVMRRLDRGGEPFEKTLYAQQAEQP